MFELGIEPTVSCVPLAGIHLARLWERFAVVSPQTLDDHIKNFLLKHIAGSGEVRVVFLARDDTVLPAQYAVHIQSSGPATLDEESSNWDNDLLEGIRSAEGVVDFHPAGANACLLDPCVLETPEATLLPLGEELRLVAATGLMETAMGLVDGAAKYVNQQRNFLKRVARDREGGTLQPDLCKAFHPPLTPY